MRALRDDHSRVVTVAIEALAVVHHMIGDDIQPVLISAGASVSSRLMLAGRFASKDLPGIKADGAVEHEASERHIAYGLLQRPHCMAGRSGMATTSPVGLVHVQNADLLNKRSTNSKLCPLRVSALHSFSIF